MRYKKVRGRSVAECMMKIRSNFGPDAIILEHREVNEGGLLGSGLFSRKSYEIEYMLPEGGRVAKSHSLPLTSAKKFDNGKLSGPQGQSSLSPLHSPLLGLEQEGRDAGKDQSTIRRILKEAIRRRPPGFPAAL